MIYEYRIVFSDEDVNDVKLEFLKKGIVLSRLKFVHPFRTWTYGHHHLRTEMEILYCCAATKFQHLVVL